MYRSATVLKRRECHSSGSACVFSNTNSPTNGDVDITFAVANDSPSNIRVGWTLTNITDVARVWVGNTHGVVLYRFSKLSRCANDLKVFDNGVHLCCLFILISNTCVFTETALQMSSDKINYIGQKSDRWSLFSRFLFYFFVSELRIFVCACYTCVAFHCIETRVQIDEWHNLYSYLQYWRSHRGRYRDGDWTPVMARTFVSFAPNRWVILVGRR